MKVKKSWWDNNDLSIIDEFGNLTRFCNAEITLMKNEYPETLVKSTSCDLTFLE